MSLEKGVYYDKCVSWQNSVSLCPASFCTTRPNLPVIPDISLLFSIFFNFCIPVLYDEKDFFFLVLVLGDLVGLQRTIQLQLLQH